jgi:hypothetical protein
VILFEVALNERGQGGNRGMGVAAAGAKMENRVLSRFRRHHLDDAFASIHGPSGDSANSMLDVNALASLVSLTDGRA